MTPVRRQIVVAADQQTAFKVFTSEIGAWWPVATHSVHEGEVSFHDGQIVERGPAGEVAVWGTVLAWEPPQRLRVTWHPGKSPDNPTEVEVEFASVGSGQTLVTLTHTGWERWGDALRENYRHGWAQVIGLYGDAFPPADVDGEVWLALMHSASAEPDIREHFAFLTRLRDRGVLVAAGPLDGEGDGMTVVRTSDPAEIVRLAQDDDLSVASDALQVRVRPWDVRLTGHSAG